MVQKTHRGTTGHDLMCLTWVVTSPRAAWFPPCAPRGPKIGPPKGPTFIREWFAVARKAFPRVRASVLLPFAEPGGVLGSNDSCRGGEGQRQEVVGRTGPRLNPPVALALKGIRSLTPLLSSE